MHVTFKAEPHPSAGGAGPQPALNPASGVSDPVDQRRSLTPKARTSLTVESGPHSTCQMEPEALRKCPSLFGIVAEPAGSNRTSKRLIPRTGSSGLTILETEKYRFEGAEALAKDGRT